MKKKTILFTVLGFAALVLFSACTGPIETIEYRYILDGTVRADAFMNVDLTQVQVRLKRNGKNVGRAVAVNRESGAFEISGVETGDGYTVSAGYGSFYAETEPFDVPEKGSGLELVLKGSADITGKISIIDPLADVEAVDVILLWLDNEKARVKPDAQGNYTFANMEQKEDSFYQVLAELAGFDKANSDMFALSGAYTVPHLTIFGFPPEPLECVYESAIANDQFVLTFDRPVDIDMAAFNSANFGVSSNFIPPPSVTAISSNDSGAGLEWVLTLHRGANVDKLENLSYDGMFITEKGSSLKVKSFSIPITTIVAGIEVFAATYNSFLGRNLVLVYFDQEYVQSTFDISDWKFTSSVNGDIAIAEYSLLTSGGAKRIAFEIPGVPQAGEALTVSYTKPASGGLESAENGSVLQTFTDYEVWIP